MKHFLKRLMKKQDPAFYKAKDLHLTPSLTTKDLLGLGIGMVVPKLCVFLLFSVSGDVLLCTPGWPVELSL